MKPWLRIASGIDKLSERSGQLASWLVFVMVLVGAYNAIVRFTGKYTGLNLSSNTYIELQWYLFSIIFLLAAASALKQDTHVRVDVLYGRLNVRRRAWVNLCGSILFLIPFAILMLWVSWPSVRNSWIVLEDSPDPGGLPRYPLKSFTLVCFTLLLFQGISETIKNIHTLRSQSDRRNSPGNNKHAPEWIPPSREGL